MMKELAQFDQHQKLLWSLVIFMFLTMVEKGMFEKDLLKLVFMLWKKEIGELPVMGLLNKSIQEIYEKETYENISD